MKDWGRLITAMVTPFDKNLQVDFEKAIELAKKLVTEGSSALVVCGTTGEAPTINAEEKEKLFTIIKKNVKVPIIAGVGTNSTSATIENGKRALACGVDGLLVVVPYYNKPNQDSMYLHFKAVAEALEGDIILYNVPGRTGCNMLPATLGKLSQIKNIVALKEASGNIVQLSEMLELVSDDFRIYTGDDVMTLPSLAVGAYGVVSVASHVVGLQMKEMIDCYLKGEVEKAKEIHLELLDIFNKLFITTNPIPVKAALNMMNINVGDLRLPLSPATPEVQAEIQRSLRKIKLI
jgi:4-hydroxy-tetrahydrodipicolinate synthase